MFSGIFKKETKKHVKRFQNYSYSQSGEDLIACRILGRLKIANPTYLDIGANQPVQLNNTYKLYERGSRGVLVEPNPVLYNELCKTRKEDISLNVGVGLKEEGELDLYVLSNKFFSTFSKEEAEKVCKDSDKKVEMVVKIKVVDINQIISENFDMTPNFLSLDAEGMDFKIIKTLDFKKYKPEVLCVETLEKLENNTEIKNTEIIDYIKSKGYMVYADTYINTIFADEEKWRNRNHPAGAVTVE